MLIVQDHGMQDSIQQQCLQHIGYHFDKEGRHIDPWVCIEHNKKKGLITKEDRKKTKTCLRDVTADDTSDLDDGIPFSYVSGYATNASAKGNKGKVDDTDIDLE